MTSCVPSGTDQSSRARPPLVVSPDTPALAIDDVVTLARSAASQLVGKALAGAKAVARHQAVAEADDRERLGCGRRSAWRSQGTAASVEQDRP